MGYAWWKNISQWDIFFVWELETDEDQRIFTNNHHEPRHTLRPHCVTNHASPASYRCWRDSLDSLIDRSVFLSFFFWKDVRALLRFQEKKKMWGRPLPLCPLDRRPPPAAGAVLAFRIQRTGTGPTGWNMEGCLHCEDTPMTFSVWNIKELNNVWRSWHKFRTQIEVSNTGTTTNLQAHML